MRIYTQNDVDFMQTLSNRVALAISRVELYEQMRNQTRDLSVRNTELDAFSYTVAHDLRNLLASVIGYAELLADDFDIVTPADRARYIDTIISHGYKMKQVIDSLLMLARLRTMDMEMDVVDMQSVVKEVTHRLQDHFVETKANIHILGDWLKGDWPRRLAGGSVGELRNQRASWGAPPRWCWGRRCRGKACVSGCATMDPASPRRIRRACSSRSCAYSPPAPTVMAWGFRLCGALWNAATATSVWKVHPARAARSGLSCLPMQQGRPQNRWQSQSP
ncbi:MAG: histidine kinase dimerization/phospho-acceptor domain-containing protein [Caldilineaceae bacterium]